MHRQTVIVTGANGGLGIDVVRYLWHAGYDVICTYRNNRADIDFLTAIVAETLSVMKVNDAPTKEYINERVFKVDLTQAVDVEAFAKTVIERHGTPWGIINLAGGSSNAMSWKLEPDEFTAIINMNLLSTFLVNRAFTPSMRTAGKGRIINTSSVVGETGIAGASHYAAAKAGVIGLTKSLALELAPKNITVNALGLGYFNVGLIDDVPKPIVDAIIEKTPLKRLGVAHDLAPAILFLLSDGSEFITGQTLNINGGLT